MQRLGILNAHFEPAFTEKKESLSVVDNRTGNHESFQSVGKKYELPIKDNCINATDLSKIKDDKGEVTRSFDPAYMNTVCCVTFPLTHILAIGVEDILY